MDFFFLRRNTSPNLVTSTYTWMLRNQSKPLWLSNRWPHARSIMVDSFYHACLNRPDLACWINKLCHFIRLACRFTLKSLQESVAIHSWHHWSWTTGYTFSCQSVAGLCWCRSGRHAKRYIAVLQVALPFTWERPLFLDHRQRQQLSWFG
jgi:hypothetical protein